MSVSTAVHGPHVDSAPGRSGTPSLFDESSDPDNAHLRGGVVRRVAVSGGSRRRAEPPVAAGGPERPSTRAVRPPAGSPAVPVPQAARDLIADASRGLGRAMRATTAADRYAAAHLAALRAAAAVLAARARPVRGRRGSAWELIAKVAPEFGEWAAFFAAGSAKRQAAEAGLHRLVTAREADDMVRQAAVFVDLVDSALAGGAAGRDRSRQRRTR